MKGRPPVLRQVTNSAIALAELKGLAHTLPNPSILLNAVILKEARASSEVENVITTHDRLYQALSAKGLAVDSATKEVLRYTPPDDKDTILTLMKNLEDYLNTTDEISPLIKLAVQHYQFESTHPFYDRNGHTGRINRIRARYDNAFFKCSVSYKLPHNPDY